MLYGAMNFPVMPVLDELEAVAALGFDYFELAMDAPRAHYKELLTLQKYICRRLAYHDMGIVCHLPTFVSTADLTESIRRASWEEMRQSLNVAAVLGAKKAVLHPSMIFGMAVFAIEEVAGYAIDFLEAMTDSAERLNMVLCLENMMPRNILGVEPEYFEQVLDRFSTLKMTIDTGHANLDDPAGRRLEQLVRRFGPRIGHVHVSDNCGARDDHQALGNGTVDFPRFVNTLKSIGYSETITLEIFDQDRQKMIESREYIERLLQAEDVTGEQLQYKDG